MKTVHCQNEMKHIYLWLCVQTITTNLTINKWKELFINRHISIFFMGYACLPHCNFRVQLPISTLIFFLLNTFTEYEWLTLKILNIPIAINWNRNKMFDVNVNVRWRQPYDLTAIVLFNKKKENILRLGVHP